MDGTIRARRCTLCSKSYPPHIERCPIHGTDTWAMYKSGPDDDWEQHVAQSLGEGVYLDPKPAGYGFAHPRPHLEVPVTFENDRLWIKHSDLIEGGYTNLEAGTIVWVNDRFFELQGPRGPLWWVDEIVTEGAADDLTPAMFEKWRKDEDD